MTNAQVYAWYKLTKTQKVAAAIIAAIHRPHSPAWRQWADAWLRDEDRSESAAWAATRASRDCTRDASYAAWFLARAMDEIASTFEKGAMLPFHLCHQVEWLQNSETNARKAVESARLTDVALGATFKAATSHSQRLVKGMGI
jgi:hypothetical protein